MPVHQMRLNDQPYDQIASGRKTIEIRLLDEKRRTIQVGDDILFSRRSDEHDKIEAKVIELVTAPNFLELFRRIDVAQAGWPAGTTPEQATQDMRQYYPEDEEQRWGTVAIKIAK